METDRIKQKLISEISKKSVNLDTYQIINIDNKEKILPPDTINEVVNLNDRFNLERQSSPFYRIIGTITPIISNPLFNLDNSSLFDKYTWKDFNYEDILTNKFRFFNSLYPNNIDNYLKEKDGWFGYFDPDITKSGFCNYYDMEPKRDRFTFTPDINPFNAPDSTPIKNWELVITYPASTDTTHNMVNGGLLIVDVTSAIVGNRNMTAIGMACLHNLNVGDFVRISGTNGYNGDFIVVRLGLDDGDLKSYYFVIDVLNTGSISSKSRIKRLFGGIESSYYFRKFRKIKTRNHPVIQQDDYEVYDLAFSKNNFYDNIEQFVFNEDIDISNLVDNLGRPLSEIYLTVIKTDSNGLFTNISSGIETPFIPQLNNSNNLTHLLDIPVINKIHNGIDLPFTSHNPLETNVTFINNNDDYYGDLVEYNLNELKETILAHISHRFNTVNRESNPSITYVANKGSKNTNPETPPTTITTTLGPRQEGYFYKSHYLIKIREYSAYIEDGDEYTYGIPDYATKMSDGRYLWRDLLDIGVKQFSNINLDYPFVNGCHYMYNNYCFMLRRQDPFDNWGLFYSKFPSDPIGEIITSKFNTQDISNDC
jgi:hypothetical protein